MQTHTDFRIGMLIRWYGEDDDDKDPDDLGVVIALPGPGWTNAYDIVWLHETGTFHHDIEDVEENLYQGRMEIVEVE